VRRLRLRAGMPDHALRGRRGADAVGHPTTAEEATLVSASGR
jgi:hypothetical protein